MADRAAPFDSGVLPAPEKIRRRHRSYSYDEMLDMLGFMISLDDKTIDFLWQKLAAPELSCAELGSGRKVSRQAVHKFIQHRCRELPELSGILQRRKIQIETNRNSIFMEAICRIQ